MAAAIAVLVLASLTLATAGASPAPQAVDTLTPTATDTDTPTPTATDTPTPTATHTPTPTESGFSRPLIVLMHYRPSGTVKPGSSFTLEFRLGNVGNATARNVVINISSGDFIPAGSGGVIAAGAIAQGADTGYSQPLVASSTLAAGSTGTVQMAVSYTDPADESFSESFTLAIPVGQVASPVYTGPYPTVTPRVRPQLVITDYSTDVEPLRPGRQFVLTLTAVNVGGAAARGVSLIVGGGTAGASGDGTQEPGGVSGGSGSFETFAPLGSSNVQYLGDFAVGGGRDVQHHLIVNTTANPGAYPLKVSFVYKDDGGVSYTDDQVVTLLIYSPPIIEVSFYQPTDLFFVGQPGVLPLQVVNLDRKSVVLGRMRVSAEAGELTNNVLPIGMLDAGGYFTLDAVFIAAAAGPAEITVTVDYLDDFNQPQRITQTLPIEVMEPEEGMEGSGGGGGTEVPTEPVPSQPETFWQKVVRFLKGLFGLDSGTEVPEIPTPVPDESPSGIIQAPKG
jgi:hypothetical protein